jgi:hypothetical protein
MTEEDAMSSYRYDERDTRHPDRGPMPDPRHAYLPPARRGPMGKLAKWGLIAFNVVMGLFVLLPLIIVQTFDNPSNSEVLAGYLGSALLFGSAFSFWLVTNIILGAIVWLTKPD